jgi:hypothetical protein
VDDWGAAAADDRDMSMSPHTHIALQYTRDEELRQATRHAPTLAQAQRHVEDARSVGSIRRRLAQMHLVGARA